MSIRYSRFRNSDGSENVSVFDPGSSEVLVATNEHPNWSAIVTALDTNDEAVFDLFDVSKTVENRVQSFNELSDRVSVANGRVYFDGDLVDNAITKQILRFIEEDVDDWAPLVEFWERLQANPSEHSREQLYRWLEAHDFTITTDGKFLAYKGVERVVDVAIESYQSISSGSAVVNGEAVTGNIPNNVGDVVTMPRSQVTFDPADGCNVGLHAGTWSYANGFARGAVLTVEIDPRDVVSVPVDCDSQKLRVCRYVVIEVTDQENTAAYAGADEDYEYEDDDLENDEDYEDDFECECFACRSGF